MSSHAKNAWHNVAGITPDEMIHAEEETMRRYGDIINATRPADPNRKHASINNRAAQFSPFAALTGYGQEIAEESRYTESRIDLNEDQKAELDAALHEVQKVIKDKPLVTLSVFESDPSKEGGFYNKITKRVKRIDPLEETIQFTDKSKVNFADILFLHLEKVEIEQK